MARIKENDTVVMDYVPARQVATAGFYDTASGTFKTALTPANLSADGNTVPTPSDPMDIYCNNGKIKTLDRDDSVIKTGCLINTEGKWRDTGDTSTSIVVPLTVGKKYTMLINKKGLSLGTVFRYGQSSVDTATSAGIQLEDWFYGGSGNLQDGAMVSITAKQPYFVLQVTSTAATNMVTKVLSFIEAQGDNETIAIRTKNLFDADTIFGQRTQYTKESNGDWTASVSDGAGWGALYTNGFFITLNPGTYTLSSTEPNTHFSYANAASSSDISDLGGGSWYALPKTFTVTQPTNFTVKIRRKTGGSWVYPCNIGKIQLEKKETATDYIDYNGSTATANNLFAVSTYKDEQEILTGLTSHRLGILVLDGLETYNLPYSFYIHTDSCDAYITLDNAQSMQSQNSTGVCTHLKLANKDIWSLPGYPNTFAFNGKQLHLNFAHDVIGTTSSSTTAEALAAIKSYIAAQYAAGTPVIVVYPLATEYAEPAPVAQTVNVVAGDNTLSLIQQGMTPLEVSATYTAGVSVTITEIEDANVGNNVEVVIA